MTTSRPVLPPEVNDLAGQFLHQFYALIRLVSLYELNNEVFEEPLREFQGLQQKLIALEGKMEFRFFENEVFFNLTRVRLTPDIRTMVFEMLMFFRESGIGGFSLLGVFSGGAAKGFLEALGHFFRSQQKNYEDLNDQLQTKGISEIHFFAYQEYREKKTVDLDLAHFRHLNLLKIYANLLVVLQDLVSIAPGTNPTQYIDSLRKTQRLMQKLIDELQDEAAAVLQFIHFQHYASAVVQQSVNVAILSICFGKELGLSKSELGDLGMAGLFYNRPRWQIEEDPKAWGPYLHLVGMAADGGFSPSIWRRLLVGFHGHLRADGQGGIPKLKTPVIPDFYARVVAITACYYLLLMPANTPLGGGGLTPHNAVKYMFLKNPFGLDPSLLKMFINFMGVYPIGTLVQLKNGEIAMVMGPAEPVTDIHAPKIRLLRNEKGERLPDETILFARGEKAIARSLPAMGADVNVSHYFFTQRQ